mgnify:CR=1 FL=1
MYIFDNIVAGSGPSGLVVFSNLKKKSMLLTGETLKKVNSSNIHPKIKLEVDGKTNKISDLVNSKKNKFSIFSTANIGGLSNYWGAQFYNYNIDDIWPRKIFKKFKVYQKNLREIDLIYPAKKEGKIESLKYNKFFFNQVSPPILKKKIRFSNTVKNSKKIINDRVVNFLKIKKNLIKVNTEKNIYYCKKLILCAGPIGNAFILLRSFNKIKYVTFKDHNPRLFFGLDFKKKKIFNSKKTEVTNFHIKKNKKLFAFCIFYKINPYHFNKHLRSIIKISKYFFSKFLFYGQIWFKDEYNEIKINQSNNIFFLSANNFNKNKFYNNFKEDFNKIKIKILKIVNLNFGYGYHYHCLKINLSNKIYPINKFIKKLKLQNEIFCFDSSIIDKIDLKPPTKTFMATSKFLVKNFLNKN